MDMKKEAKHPLLEQLYLIITNLQTNTITLSTLLVYTTDYLYNAS